MSALQRRIPDRVVTQSDLDLLRAEFKDEIFRLQMESFRRSMNIWGTILVVAIFVSFAVVRLMT